MATSGYERRGFGVGTQDIWLYEFARSIRTRFTFDAADDRLPVWSPDGGRIVFASNRDGVYNLYQKVSSGAGSEELLFKSSENKFPLDWSRDGRFLLYATVNQKGRQSLWVLPLSNVPSPSGPPTQYLTSEFDQHSGRFSPDTRCIAYVSNESGRNEIYVQPFPDSSSGRWMVSKGGGTQPRWRRDGKEIFYVSADAKLTAVEVTCNPAFRAGMPKAPFTPALLMGDPALMINTHRYDVTADGQRFLLPARTQESVSAPITVVLNWQAELKK